MKNETKYFWLLSALVLSFSGSFDSTAKLLSPTCENQWVWIILRMVCIYVFLASFLPFIKVVYRLVKDDKND